MKYELLNELDRVQESDEWFDDSPCGGYDWRLVTPKEIGTLCGTAIYRRPIQSWQDISTAPKDGTPVLVGWWTKLTDWDREKKISIHRDWYWNTTVAMKFENDRCWGLVETGSYACDNELSEDPTRWMPLPAEPEKPQQKEL